MAFKPTNIINILFIFMRVANYGYMEFLKIVVGENMGLNNYPDHQGLLNTSFFYVALALKICELFEKS